MPLKTCPKCKTQCGVRTLKCKECDHDFKRTAKVSKAKSPASPAKKTRTSKQFRKLCGIGAWIKDTPKGMPKVEMPEELSELPKKLAIKDISHYIAYEGIGSCVIELIKPDRIKDKKLAAMWDDANKRLVEIIDYVARREINSLTSSEDQ
jgi:hypothetical protein